ncbi:MAG: hypothetical protein AB7G37_05910 [Solirubrobacteraceae bacterium]
MADPATTSQHELLESLTEAEIDALVSAAGWYASYHQSDIRERWDDRSAAEATRRNKFLALHHGLRKMGVRRPHPAPVTEIIEI